MFSQRVNSEYIVFWLATFTLIGLPVGARPIPLGIIRYLDAHPIAKRVPQYTLKTHVFDMSRRVYGSFQPIGSIFKQLARSGLVRPAPARQPRCIRSTHGGVAKTL